MAARVGQLEAEKQAWERERDAMRGELDALRCMVSAGGAPGSEGAAGEGMKRRAMYGVTEEEEEAEARKRVKEG